MTTSIIVAKDCDQSGISDSSDVTAERPASANYYASPSVELRKRRPLDPVCSFRGRPPAQLPHQGHYFNQLHL
jgi:hypothetical protein